MIEYKPNGEVTVTFEDDEVYTLRRPKFADWRRFRKVINEATEHARDQLAEKSQTLRDLSEQLASAKAKDRPAIQEKADAAAEDLAAFASTPFYETSSEVIRQMFEALGDKPLPEDKDEWPTYLVADVSLPNQILAHWQQAPKAFGAVPADIR